MKIYFSLLDLLYQGPRSKFLSGGGEVFLQKWWGGDT